MKNKILLVSGISFLAIQLFSSAAIADEDIMARITKLEQELAVLKRQAEIDKEEAAKKAAVTPSIEISEKGLRIKSADKSFQMKVGGLIQADSRTFLHDTNDSGTDQFLLRRVRPILEGTLYNDYSFRIIPDFGNGQAKLVDAYADAAFIPEAKIRVGKFKPPIGLEALQSDPASAFSERNLPSSLIPSRDVGIELSGRLFKDSLNYQFGVFDGTTDGGSSDTDTDDSKEMALRFFATPFANSNHYALQKVGLGVGGSYGEQGGSASNTELDVYKTVAQNTFFSYLSGTYANGTHTRITPQASYYYNSFGILAEYAISQQDVHLQNNRDTLEHKAWGVTASYVLTGEDESYNSVKPAANFDPKNGTWGAFEVVGRYGELKIDDKAFPLFANPSASARKTSSVGAGINWYLNESVKIMLNYSFSSFDGGASNEADRADEQAVLTRIQYNF